MISMPLQKRRAIRFDKEASDTPSLETEETPSPRLQLRSDYESKLDALICRVERARRILVEI